MALVYKINTAKIRKNELIHDEKNGFLIVPITFMKTGVLFYRDWNTGNIVGEYVSPEELFNPESMASANGVIFTDEHPPDMVYPDNWSKYMKGSLHSVEKQNDIFIAGKITVYDADTIRSIQAEEKDEISAGYWTDTIQQNGIFDGIEYQYIQTKIFYNHISRVWFGRAGEDVRMKKNIRKNNIDYQIDFEVKAPEIKKNFGNKKENFKIMIFKRKNGISRDVKLEDADEMFLQEFTSEIEAEITAKKNEAEAEKEKASALQAELDLTKKKLNEIETKDFKSEYRARLNLEDYVKPVLGSDFAMDNLSDIEVKKAYLDKVHPELKMNEKEDSYILSAFDFHQKTNKNNQGSDEKYNQVDNDFQETRNNISDMKKKGSVVNTDSILDKAFEAMSK
jgi:hypothetical protein